VTPAGGTGIDLSQVRRIAENQLRDVLLGIPNVPEAEVFGGHIRQNSVDIDRDQLIAHNLTMTQAASALAGSNVSVPAGLVHGNGEQLLLTVQNLAHVPEDLKDVLMSLPGGNHVRVGDLGEVHWGDVEATALYRGNGEESVAGSLLRGERGNASEVLESVERALPGVRHQFPMLDIEIADTQGRLIDLTVSNMLDALRDAVLMTLVVLLFFLGNTRAAWAMMIADKHGCLPSFVGLTLLMRIVVNNGTLLVGFAKVSLQEGKPLTEAMRSAVSLRTRPILTLVAVPVLFDILESARRTYWRSTEAPSPAGSHLANPAPYDNQWYYHMARWCTHRHFGYHLGSMSRQLGIRIKRQAASVRWTDMLGNRGDSK